MKDELLLAIHPSSSSVRIASALVHSFLARLQTREVLDMIVCRVAKSLANRCDLFERVQKHQGVEEWIVH
jgi:hypothetical protein